MKVKSLPSLFCLLSLALTGCLPQHSPSASYAKEAFREEYEQAKVPAQFPPDERVEDVSFTIEEDLRSKWQKQSYETIDDWVSRLKTSLKENHRQLKEKQLAVQVLKKQQEDLSNKVNQLTTRNYQLTDKLQQKEGVAEKVKRDLPLIPPFKVHLVRRGDTLFSIANQYYKDPSMVSKIMSWNRGWIRYANQLAAGIPLVLFSPGAAPSSQTTVLRFISTLDAQRDEILAQKESKQPSSGEEENRL